MRRCTAAARDAIIAAMPQSPIFVLSCIRSGSTLLRYVLDTHPSIYAPPEVSLGHLADALYLTQANLAGRRQPSGFHREDEVVLAAVRQVLSQMMEEQARRRGKAVWCDKTPGNLSYLPLIANLFPEARFIGLHRHHLDTIHSCLQASRHGFLGMLTGYLTRHPTNFLA